MADMMQFDLVSPECALASLQVHSVQLPGADGDMTAMANHAPTITTLRPGVLKAESASASNTYVVTGGFAEINATGISVLAEQAIPAEEMTQEKMDALVASTVAISNASHSVDDAAKLIADMEALAHSIGLRVMTE